MKTQHYPKDICAEALAVEEEDDEKSVATQIPCPGDADVEYILLCMSKRVFDYTRGTLSLSKFQDRSNTYMCFWQMS